MKVILNSIVSEEDYEIVLRLLTTDTPKKEDIESLFLMPYNMRMRFFEKMGTDYLFKHIEFKEIDRINDYVLYQNRYLFEMPITILQMKCPSTGKMHYILTNGWNVNLSLNLLVTNTRINCHKFYRHGDVALISNNESTNSHNYFENLIAEV